MQKKSFDCSENVLLKMLRNVILDDQVQKLAVEVANKENGWRGFSGVYIRGF